MCFGPYWILLTEAFSLKINYITLQQIVFSNNSQHESITTYFTIDNQEASPILIHTTSDPYETEDIVLLRSDERHYPIVGRGGDVEFPKPVGPTTPDLSYTFSLPEAQQSSLLFTFRVDPDMDNDLEYLIPMKIGEAKLEFNFAIPNRTTTKH